MSSGRAVFAISSMRRRSRGASGRDLSSRSVAGAPAGGFSEARDPLGGEVHRPGPRRLAGDANAATAIALREPTNSAPTGQLAESRVGSQLVVEPHRGTDCGGQCGSRGAGLIAGQQVVLHVLPGGLWVMQFLNQHVAFFRLWKHATNGSTRVARPHAGGPFVSRGCGRRSATRRRRRWSPKGAARAVSAGSPARGRRRCRTARRPIDPGRCAPPQKPFDAVAVRGGASVEIRWPQGPQQESRSRVMR